MKCIICQTNEPNPRIGKSFCSRICKNLYDRLDYSFSRPEVLKEIALKMLLEDERKSRARLNND